jgi:Uncharacterized protein conserved in bacteria (DUF2332)
LPQPLALIEVGASAGLCLLPDRYAYSYGDHSVRPHDVRADAPVFPCRASSGTPLPRTVPHIVWRAGLDLNPLDVADPEQMTWLQTLVWPEQTGRAERLRAAVRIAQADPPRLVQGDLRDGVARRAAEAAKDAPLVVFHTAVLVYLSSETERGAFGMAVSSLCDYWVSNEALDRGNGCLVFDVPNRGNQPIMPRVSGASEGGHLQNAGNGFLMRRGFTVVWSGWQADVPPGIA